MPTLQIPALAEKLSDKTLKATRKKNRPVSYSGDSPINQDTGSTVLTIVSAGTVSS